MFSPDVRLEGFTHDDWQRLLTLFRPVRPPEVSRDPGRPQGLVLALHDGTGLLKLLHSQVGRLRLDDLPGAGAAFQKALDLDDDDPEVWREYAGILERQGKTAEAASARSRALTLESGP